MCEKILNTKMKNETFKTDDLNLASALKATGYAIEVEMVSPTKAVFCIPHTTKLDDDVSSFWSNGLPVSPLLFQSSKIGLLQIINRLKGVQ